MTGINIKTRIKAVLVLMALLLLNACGDACFEDVVFPPDGGMPYQQHNETIYVKAVSNNFVGTTKKIPKNTVVTINISGGPVFLCGKNKGSVAISSNNSEWYPLLGPPALGDSLTAKYAVNNGDSVVFGSGCDPNDDKGSTSSTVPCNPSISCNPSVDSQCTSCTNATGTNCNGASTKVKCQICSGGNCTNETDSVCFNGSATNITCQNCTFNCSNETNATGLCSSSGSVSSSCCSSFSYDVQCQKCSSTNNTCAAATGSTCLGSNSSNVRCKNATRAQVNQISDTSYYKDSCTNPQASQYSNYNQWQWLDDGNGVSKTSYCSVFVDGSGNTNYTVPFDSGSGGSNVNANYLYQHITDTNKTRAYNNRCWYTAGMGIALKAVTSGDDCSSPGTETWFVNNPIAPGSSATSPGTCPPNDYTLVRCEASKKSFGLSACHNNLQDAVVERIIHVTEPVKFYCVKFVDAPNSYGDNVGGFNLFYSAQRCIGSYGHVVPGITLQANGSKEDKIKADNVGALEYITHSDNNYTPSSDSSYPHNQVVALNQVPNCSTSHPHASQSCNPVPGEAGCHTYEYTMPDNDYLLFRVYDWYYPDNLGTYTVNLSWKTCVGGKNTIAKEIDKLRNMIRKVVFYHIPQYYCQTTCPNNDCGVSTPCPCTNEGSGTCSPGDGGVCKSPYIDYIRTLLVFYILSYAFAFLMGFTEISQKDLLIRVIKIGLVLQLTNDNSWNFFSNYFFDIFIYGSDQLISLATFTKCNDVTYPSICGAVHETCPPPAFYFVDKMFNLIFLDKALWLKIWSLLFTTPIGLILGILLIIGMLYFILGIISAVAEYLMAVIAVAALMLLGPIFIPFVLFETTRNMFQTWIYMLFRYAMEPVFLVIGLSFLFEIYYSVFREMFQFNVCWKCMWGVQFPTGFDDIISSFFRLSKGQSFLCIQGLGPWGFAPSGGGAILSALGIDVSGLLLLIILSAVVRNYTKFVTDVMTQLVGARASVWKMTGGQRQSYGSTGDAFMDSVGLSKIEKGVNKMARKGAYKALGIKTEEDKEKDLEKYEDALNARQLNKSQPGNRPPMGVPGKGQVPPQGASMPGGGGQQPQGHGGQMPQQGGANPGQQPQGHRGQIPQGAPQQQGAGNPGQQQPQGHGGQMPQQGAGNPGQQQPQGHGGQMPQQGAGNPGQQPQGHRGQMPQGAPQQQGAGNPGQQQPQGGDAPQGSGNVSRSGVGKPPGGESNE